MLAFLPILNITIYSSQVRHLKSCVENVLTSIGCQRSQYVLEPLHKPERARTLALDMFECWQDMFAAFQTTEYYNLFVSIDRVAALLSPDFITPSAFWWRTSCEKYQGGAIHVLFSTLTLLKSQHQARILLADQDLDIVRALHAHASKIVLRFLDSALCRRSSWLGQRKLPGVLTIIAHMTLFLTLKTGFSKHQHSGEEERITSFQKYLATLCVLWDDGKLGSIEGFNSLPLHRWPVALIYKSAAGLDNFVTLEKEEEIFGKLQDRRVRNFARDEIEGPWQDLAFLSILSIIPAPYYLFLDLSSDDIQFIYAQIRGITDLPEISDGQTTELRSKFYLYSWLMICSVNEVVQQNFDLVRQDCQSTTALNNIDAKLKGILSLLRCLIPFVLFSAGIIDMVSLRFLNASFQKAERFKLGYHFLFSIEGPRLWYPFLREFLTPLMIELSLRNFAGENAFKDLLREIFSQEHVPACDPGDLFLRIALHCNQIAKVDFNGGNELRLRLLLVCEEVLGQHRHLSILMKVYLYAHYRSCGRVKEARDMRARVASAVAHVYNTSDISVVGQRIDELLRAVGKVCQ